MTVNRVTVHFQTPPFTLLGRWQPPCEGEYSTTKKKERKVNPYSLNIEIQEEKLMELMERLDKAQEEIYNCYSELSRLGILKITKTPANDSEGGKGD